MAYRFRLSSVLRVRRVQEDIARHRLAEAHVLLRRAEDDRLRRVRHYDALPVPAGPCTYDEFIREGKIQALAAESVGLGNTRVAEATGAAEQRRVEFLSARQRLRTIEKLDERQRADYELMENRRANAVVDDIVATRSALVAQGLVRGRTA